MESKKMIIKGAKVKWAKVFEPDGTFPPARWSVNVYPTDADANQLQAAGISLRNDEKDGGAFFVAKRNAVSTKTGKEVAPPRVVGPDKAKFAEPIGNGSVCNVIIDVYPWTFGKNKGIGAWLEAVQVIEHVPYAAKDGVDFDAVQQPQHIEGPDEDSLPF